MYLLVHPNGTKYWRLNYRFDGKQKTFALGVYPLISLAEARVAKIEAKTQIAKGIDPNELKKEILSESAPEITFEYIARQWHASNKAWTADHRTRVLRSLEKDLFPYIGNKQVSELNTPQLLAPIKRVDKAGNHDTATRLQQRVTSIMRFAVQNGLIDYNPAKELAGALSTKKTRHRPALNREEWLAVRKQGIGSSDAAAAVGLNPYQSQLELWMIKTGRSSSTLRDEGTADHAPMHWGT